MTARLPVDPARLKTRFRRAFPQLCTEPPFLQLLAAQEISDRLSFIKREFRIAAEVGGLHPGTAALITETVKTDRMVRIVPGPQFTEASGPGAPPAIIADESGLPLAEGVFDLITAPLSLQHVNDLPGLLIQIRRALKPDGLFIGALCGGETLYELRDVLITAEAEIAGGAAHRVMPMGEIRDMGGLLQRAGFALPVADAERQTVTYQSMFHLIRDLRAMASAGLFRQDSDHPLTREILMRAAALYQEKYATPDARVAATFDLIYLTAWCPDSSQQKPLKPGSAQVSLAKILGEDASD